MPGGNLPDSVCWQRALILSFLGLLGPFVDNVVELGPTGPTSEVRNDLLEVWHHPIALLGLCLPIEGGKLHSVGVQVGQDGLILSG